MRCVRCGWASSGESPVGLADGPRAHSQPRPWTGHLRAPRPREGDQRTTRNREGRADWRGDGVPQEERPHPADRSARGLRRRHDCGNLFACAGRTRPGSESTASCRRRRARERSTRAVRVPPPHTSPWLKACIGPLRKHDCARWVEPAGSMAGSSSCSLPCCCCLFQSLLLPVCSRHVG